MKFSEMPYARPDLEAAKAQCAALCSRIAGAQSAEEALAAAKEFDEMSSHIETLAILAEVRHTIDTRDAFYEAEQDFFDANGPALG